MIEEYLALFLFWKEVECSRDEYFISAAEIF